MSNHVDRLRSALEGRYALEREVGRGGMATVYLAHDVRHRRKVAVKVLEPDLALAIGPARFLREIEAAARMSHPNILPLHDSGDADGTLYYVMPFIEGESLQERLSREGQLAIDDALRIAREIADALSYAHERGVVHRDVKPANILLESGHALLADFGVALVARAVASDRLTRTGVSPGTPVYMSPEQAGGEAHIDGRSDVYSLGCVLYEMLGGDPPYAASSARALLAKKLVEPVPSLRVVRETVTPPLDQLVLKALARAPADRFQTAAELARALDAVALDRTARAWEATGGWGGARAGLPLPDGDAATRAPTAGASGTTTGLSRWLGIGAASVAMLTSIGFLTTIAYDLALRLPSQYTPSRTDFPVLGVRALIPGVFNGFVVLVAFVVLNHLLRVLLLGLGRIRAPGVTADGRPRIAGAWRRLRDTATPPALADLYFVGTVALSTAVLLLFWRLQPGAPERAGLASVEIFSCAFRGLHRSYTLVMAAMITGLAFTWQGTFRYLESRQASGGRIALARWGGLAWIVVLVLLMTAPWRLLWSNEHPRALLNGERIYILLERDADLVLYNAERRTTQQYRMDETSELVRLNTTGYVFEDEGAFEGQLSGC